MKIRRGLSEMNNPEDDLEAAGMLANEAHNTGYLANGSSGHTLAEQVIVFFISIYINNLGKSTFIESKKNTVV